MAVPRVVGETGGALVCISGGGRHSLATTAEGQVLAFGDGGSGRLGLGAGVNVALTPTAINGITLGGEEEGREGKEGKE